MISEQEGEEAPEEGGKEGEEGEKESQKGSCHGSEKAQDRVSDLLDGVAQASAGAEPRVGFCIAEPEDWPVVEGLGRRVSPRVREQSER